MKAIIKSWRTTLAGIMQFVVLAWGQLQFLLDNLPETNPDWGLIFSSFIALIGLLSARDSVVTSEQAGLPTDSAEKSGALQHEMGARQH